MSPVIESGCGIEESDARRGKIQALLSYVNNPCGKVDVPIEESAAIILGSLFRSP